MKSVFAVVEDHSEYNEEYEPGDEMRIPEEIVDYYGSREAAAKNAAYRYSWSGSKFQVVEIPLRDG